MKFDFVAFNRPLVAFDFLFCPFNFIQLYDWGVLLLLLLLLSNVPHSTFTFIWYVFPLNDNHPLTWSFIGHNLNIIISIKFRQFEYTKKKRSKRFIFQKKQFACIQNRPTIYRCYYSNRIIWWNQETRTLNINLKMKAFICIMVCLTFCPELIHCKFYYQLFCSEFINEICATLNSLFSNSGQHHMLTTSMESLKLRIIFKTCEESFPLLSKLLKAYLTSNLEETIKIQSVKTRNLYLFLMFFTLCLSVFRIYIRLYKFEHYKIFKWKATD